jgi:membrane protease YdiL (CAAX protease family)
VSRYSKRQLIVAKCVLVGLLAVIGGSLLADQPRAVGIGILTVLALVGGAAAAYEFLSRVLALLLGRVWKDTASSPAGSPSGDLQFPTERPARPGLRVRHVLVVFGVYLAAGALVWLAVAVVILTRVGLGAGQEAIAGMLKTLLPVALPVSVASGSLAALVALWSWGKRLGAQAVADILGLRSATSRQLWEGVLAGVTLGIIALVLVTHIPYRPTSPDLIDEIVSSPGPARWALALSAVFLAPPIEEFVFRGVLLGGLAQTWSLRGAVLVSGFTFWLLHATEWLRYWPAAVAIGLMTIIVTLLRLRTRTLGPAIAAHAAYNLVTSVALAGSAPDRPREPIPEGPRWAQACPLSLRGPCISHQPGYRISEVTLDLEMEGNQHFETEYER